MQNIKVRRDVTRIVSKPCHTQKDGTKYMNNIIYKVTVSCGIMQLCCLVALQTGRGENVTVYMLYFSAHRSDQRSRQVWFGNLMTADLSWQNQ